MYKRGRRRTWKQHHSTSSFTNLTNTLNLFYTSKQTPRINMQMSQILNPSTDSSSPPTYSSPLLSHCFNNSIPPMPTTDKTGSSHIPFTHPESVFTKDILTGWLKALVHSQPFSDNTLFHPGAPFSMETSQDSIQLPTIPVAGKGERKKALVFALNDQTLNFPGEKVTSRGKGLVLHIPDHDHILSRFPFQATEDFGPFMRATTKPSLDWVNTTVKDMEFRARYPFPTDHTQTPSPSHSYPTPAPTPAPEPSPFSTMPALIPAIGMISADEPSALTSDYDNDDDDLYYPTADEFQPETSPLTEIVDMDISPDPTPAPETFGPARLLEKFPIPSRLVSHYNLRPTTRRLSSPPIATLPDPIVKSLHKTDLRSGKSSGRISKSRKGKSKVKFSHISIHHAIEGPVKARLDHILDLPVHKWNNADNGVVTEVAGSLFRAIQTRKGYGDFDMPKKLVTL